MNRNNTKTAACIALLTGLWAFASCVRLDSNLFNNKQITQYLMEANTDPQEISLDGSYTISDSLVHLFTLESDDNGDKATIYAQYLGSIAHITTDTVILYLHGTRDNMDYYWNRSKLLANVGGKNRFGVMTIDYRGYGMSKGKPTESGMYADAEAALKWLKNNGLSGSRLIIYGYSLGSAPATYRAANPGSLTPAKLILEAPFAAASVMVQDAAVLAMPPSYFTNLSIDNAREIKKVTQPFMWIHGINDDFLSIKTHGELVFANYSGTYGQPHRIAGANHVNVPTVWGLEAYKSAIATFICH
jgi:pimeloyl-ACP methyl ester carboxylesterase